MNEQVGKHKGAVETLLHEKKELSRLLQIVNSQLERHLSSLEEAGVDTDQFIQQVQQGQKQTQKEQSLNNQRQQNSNRNNPQNRTSSNQQRKQQGSRNRDTGESEESGDRDFSPL